MDTDLIRDLKAQIADLEDERDIAIHEARRWETICEMRRSNTEKLIALFVDIQALQIVEVQTLFEKHAIELP